MAFSGDFLRLLSKRSCGIKLLQMHAYNKWPMLKESDISELLNSLGVRVA